MEQQVIPSDYTQYAEAVEIIKHAIERCRYRSAAAVNKETLSLYFGVGKFVSENSRIGCWGTKALPTISKLLQRELPGLHGFSESGLKRMRSFYEEWRTFLIRPTVLGELENHSSKKGTDLIRPTLLDELDIDEHLLLQYRIYWGRFCQDQLFASYRNPDPFKRHRGTVVLYPLCRSKCVVIVLSQKLLERRHLFKSRLFAKQLPSSAARSHLCRKSGIGVQG